MHVGQTLLSFMKKVCWNYLDILLSVENNNIEVVEVKFKHGKE